MRSFGSSCFAALLASLHLVAGTALAQPPAKLTVTAPVDRSSTAPVDVYRLDVTVNLSEGTLDGRMALRYRNVSSMPLSSVRLRLDPNLNAGVSIEIVAVDDADGHPLPRTLRPLTFGKLSSEAGALDVALARPLPPGAETTVKIQFRSSGRHITADLLVLQDDPYHSFDAWYPKAMTPRDAGWSIDDDRLADYDVTLRYPASYTVASASPPAPAN